MASSDPNLIGAARTSAVSVFSEALKRQVRVVQDYTLLSAQGVARIFSPPHYVADLLEQMDIIGVG